MSIQQILFAAAAGSSSAAAKHWRLSITGPGDITYQQRITEVDFSPTAPTYTRQAIQSVSSSLPVSSGPIENVIDNNIYSFALWSINPTPSVPLNIDLVYASPFDMKQMRVGITAQNGYYPSAFNVYRSKDGTNWTLVKSFTNQFAWSSNELRVLQLT